MSNYKVGYFVGSLSSSSINRLLAKAGAPCRRGDRHDGDCDHGTMRVLIGYASRFGSTRDIAMRVILLYITAVVMPDDGSIHFAEDIYDHDTRLDGALELREMPK
jgi:hypothetical protein